MGRSAASSGSLDLAVSRVHVKLTLAGRSLSWRDKARTPRSDTAALWLLLGGLGGGGGLDRLAALGLCRRGLRHRRLGLRRLGCRSLLGGHLALLGGHRGLLGDRSRPGLG